MMLQWRVQLSDGSVRVQGGFHQCLVRSTGVSQGSVRFQRLLGHSSVRVPSVFSQGLEESVMVHSGFSD